MEIEYVGQRADGGCRVKVLTIKSGVVVNSRMLHQRYVRHSPDGFQWGYGGSGPADLALNMLIDFLSLGNDFEQAVKSAESLYQSFKDKVIAAQPDRLHITGKEIAYFLSQEA